MRIFKSFIVAIALVVGAAGVFAQQVTVNPSAINPSQINLSQVNLSGARFFFQGPAEFYVTGIRYNGMVYSAILDYNGNGQFAVKAPQVVSTAGKPMSIDLSGISLNVTSSGIQLNNVGVDGMTYSGTLNLTPQNQLVLSNYSQTGRLAAGQQAASQVSSLQSQVSSLQSQVNTKDSTISSLQNQVSSLQSSASTKDSTIGNLQQTVSALRQQLASQGVQAAPSASDYPTLLDSGFSGGTGQFGNWTLSGGELQQTNTGVLYAKYVAQMPQYASQYFYQFSAKAAGSGWRGLGVHILASGSTAANRYGYGSSYLIWVTRDPAQLQTDKTYVQLYRSFDDQHMIQVASIAVNASIDQNNTYAIAVNRSSNTITVLVNGNEAFAYSPSEQIGTGNSIALRALGTVTFSSAQIRTK